MHNLHNLHPKVGFFEKIASINTVFSLKHIWKLRPTTKNVLIFIIPLLIQMEERDKRLLNQVILYTSFTFRLVDHYIFSSRTEMRMSVIWLKDGQMHSMRAFFFFFIIVDLLSKLLGFFGQVHDVHSSDEHIYRHPKQRQEELLV